MRQRADEGFSRKDVWTKRGDGFQVTVERFEIGFPSDMPHRWCTYAYVYPGHRMFDWFKRDGYPMEQPHIDGGHSYASYFRSHVGKDGEVSAYQIGYDYSHDGDSDYQTYATADDAWEVFGDAGRMFRFLESPKDEED